MNKLSTIFIVVFSISIPLIIYVSIKSTENPSYELSEKALQSGVNVDSIMFGIKFRDTKTEVAKKLSSKTTKIDEDIYEYHFSDKRLSYMPWIIDLKACRFHNDSIIELNLIYTNYESSYNNQSILREIYSSKYGKSAEHDGTLYWFKGNLEIRISPPSKYGQTWISYTDNRAHSREDVWDELHFNTYSRDYWDKHIKPKKDSLLNISSKEI